MHFSLRDLFRCFSFIFILFAIACFMAQGFIHFYFKSLPAPPQIIATFLSGFFLLATGKIRKKGWLPVIFGLITAAIFFWHDYKPDETILKQIRFFQIITGIILFIVVYHLSFYEKWLKSLIITLFVMIIINGTIAIVEYLSNSHVPWSCYKDTTYTVGVGLEYSPVAFGYALSAPIAFAFFFMIFGKKIIDRKTHILSSYASIIGFGALIISLSRSSLLAVLTATSLSIFLLSKKHYKILNRIVILILTGFIMLTPLFHHKLKISFFSDPRIFNPSLWIVHLLIIIANPLAIPKLGSEQEVLIHFDNYFGISLPPQMIDKALCLGSPHNSFLSLGNLYGLIPMLCLLCLCLIIGIKGYYLLKRSKKFDADFVAQAASFTGIMAYFVHAHFHNASIFLGEMRNWLYIALFCRYLYKNNLNDDTKSPK